MSNPTLETILRDSALGEQIRRQEKQRENERQQKEKSEEAKKKRYELTQILLKKFAEKFPKAFGEKKIPFKIGIKDDLLKAFEKSGYSKSQINGALKFYLQSYQYYSAMLHHKKRFDLEGNYVEDISEEHLTYAAKQVAYLKRKLEKSKTHKRHKNSKPYEKKKRSSQRSI